MVGIRSLPFLELHLYIFRVFLPLVSGARVIFRRCIYLDRNLFGGLKPSTTASIFNPHFSDERWWLPDWLCKRTWAKMELLHEGNFFGIPKRQINQITITPLKSNMDTQKLSYLKGVTFSKAHHFWVSSR